jgi:hypothetical protein
VAGEGEQAEREGSSAGAPDAASASGVGGASGAADVSGAASASAGSDVNAAVRERDAAHARRAYISRRDRTASALTRPEPSNLADILERVLDKGIVIAGDIQINLLEIELLTIKLRLLIASVDRAREMGINWWESDSSLSANDRSALEDENRRLRERLEALERQVGVLSEGERDERRS